MSFHNDGLCPLKPWTKANPAFLDYLGASIFSEQWGKHNLYNLNKPLAVALWPCVPLHTHHPHCLRTTLWLFLWCPKQGLPTVLSFTPPQEFHKEIWFIFYGLSWFSWTFSSENDFSDHLAWNLNCSFWYLLYHYFPIFIFKYFWAIWHNMFYQLIVNLCYGLKVISLPEAPMYSWWHCILLRCRNFRE